MTELLRKQLLGMGGAAPAILLGVLAWAYAPLLLAGAPLPADDAGSRIAYAAQWLLAPGAMVLAGVFGAARRGFYADAIEGTRTPSNNSLEINLRYNQNTVEQTILAAIAWLAFASMAPHGELARIPLMAALFVVGRITFWAGYLIHPMARTFGMTLTVIPTLMTFGWIALELLSGA
jgi:hypothetical protein